MRIWKIVSGILSIAISLFVVFQSFFAGAYNILTGNGQASGTVGVMVALMLLIGGIVSIATHNGSMGGSIAMAILYGIGGVIGLFGAGNYADLRIWAVWALLCAVIAMIDIARSRRAEEEVFVPVRTSAPRPRYGHATLQEVITEQDPQRRNAAIDALPEREAKNYLKHVLNVFVPRQAPSDDDGDELIRILVVILVVLGVLIVAVIGIGMFLSAAGDVQNADSTPPAVSEEIQESEPLQETAAQTQAVEPAATPANSSGTLGDYDVDVQDAFLASDSDGNPAIIVTYSWTNNSDRTISAALALSEKAFQNGVQLDRAIVYPSDTPGYESGTSARDLRPGAATEVQCAFVLPDSAAIVEFELSELISFSDDTVVVDFDPAALNTVTQQ